MVKMLNSMRSILPQLLKKKCLTAEQVIYLHFKTPNTGFQVRAARDPIPTCPNVGGKVGEAPAEGCGAPRRRWHHYRAVF